MTVAEKTAQEGDDEMADGVGWINGCRATAKAIRALK